MLRVSLVLPTILDIGIIMAVLQKKGNRSLWLRNCPRVTKEVQKLGIGLRILQLESYRAFQILLFFKRVMWLYVWEILYIISSSWSFPSQYIKDWEFLQQRDLFDFFFFFSSKFAYGTYLTMELSFPTPGYIC